MASKDCILWEISLEWFIKASDFLEQRKVGWSKSFQTTKTPDTGYSESLWCRKAILSLGRWKWNLLSS